MASWVMRTRLQCESSEGSKYALKCVSQAWYLAHLFLALPFRVIWWKGWRIWSTKGCSTRSKCVIGMANSYTGLRSRDRILSTLWCYWYNELINNITVLMSRDSIMIFSVRVLVQASFNWEIQDERYRSARTKSSLETTKIIRSYFMWSKIPSKYSVHI